MTSKPTRPAMTLIEILVVLAIIALLASLVSVAVISLLGRGEDAKVAAEIMQLSSALQDFKQRFGIYPPSSFTLRQNMNAYASDPTNARIVAKIWPRLGGTSGSNPIDWGVPPKSLPIALEPDQCLVFFLGGIPNQSAPGCLGFSTSPSNPGANTSERIGPFFNFESGRLISRTGNSFYSYVDAYPVTLPSQSRQPYVYFSPATGSYPTAAASGTGASAYRNSGNVFYQKDSFQILSAGRDKIFGTGQWEANNVSLAGANGIDDRTNFTSGILGAGQ